MYIYIDMYIYMYTYIYIYLHLLWIRSSSVITSVHTRLQKISGRPLLECIGRVRRELVCGVVHTYVLQRVLQRVLQCALQCALKCALRIERVRHEIFRGIFTNSHTHTHTHTHIHTHIYIYIPSALHDTHNFSKVSSPLNLPHTITTELAFENFSVYRRIPHSGRRPIQPKNIASKFTHSIYCTQGL